MRRSRTAFILALTALMFMVVDFGAAQTVTVITYFNGKNGYTPDSIIQGPDGALYGVSLTVGEIFRANPISGVMEVLNTSVFPNGLLLTNGNTFYGATGEGGIYNMGTLFSVTPRGALTTLYNFTGGADGAGPLPPILGADGNLYGISTGDYVTNGTLYELSSNGTFSILYTFGSTGALLTGVLQTLDGYFYATSEYGGSCGWIMKLTHAGAPVATHDFVCDKEGSYPSSPVIQGADGSLYGTNSGGGAYSLGTVYKVSPSG